MSNMTPVLNHYQTSMYLDSLNLNKGWGSIRFIVDADYWTVECPRYAIDVIL